MCGKNLAALSGSLAGTLPPQLEEEEEQEDEPQSADDATAVPDDATPRYARAHRTCRPEPTPVPSTGNSANGWCGRASIDLQRPSSTEDTAAPAENGDAAKPGTDAAVAPAAHTNGDVAAEARPAEEGERHEETERPRSKAPSVEETLMDEFGPWKTFGDDHNRIYLVGYTERVQLYMRLSDVLVGKPGPGVISEGARHAQPCDQHVGGRRLMPRTASASPPRALHVQRWSRAFPSSSSSTRPTPRRRSRRWPNGCATKASASLSASTFGGGRDERGPDERGPDERGPDERGPDDRGGTKGAGRKGPRRKGWDVDRRRIAGHGEVALRDPPRSGSWGLGALAVLSSCPLVLSLTCPLAPPWLPFSIAGEQV